MKIFLLFLFLIVFLQSDTTKIIIKNSKRLVVSGKYVINTQLKGDKKNMELQCKRIIKNLGDALEKIENKNSDSLTVDKE